ncbi:MAG: peptidase domain-containing ABC transporter [Caenispirillum sp.]|nr:peptidase domain-containing ABC transporter [Caenispirillum sp.]
MHTAVKSLVLAARQHGIDLTAERLIHDHALTAEEPAAAELVSIARASGLKARAVSLGWDGLARAGHAFPFLIRLSAGKYVVVAGFAKGRDGGPDKAMLVDPEAATPALIPVGQADLAARWDGQAILLKKHHALADEDQPFGLRWFAPEVIRQKVSFTEIALVAVVLQLLALLVPIYMQIIFDKVVSNQATNTLYVVTAGVVVALVFNAVLGYLRGLLLLYATSRIDVRVTTKVFSRLMDLPIAFFQKSSAGALAKNVQQTGRIREFLTGRLFLTLLDTASLVVLIPILMSYSLAMTAVVVVFSLLIAAIMALVAGPYKRKLSALYEAEGERQSLLTEAIAGMETVKALALEPVKRRQWDEKSARAISTQFSVGTMSEASKAISGLLQQLMSVAMIFVGVHLVFAGEITMGALVAFNMLAARVSGPLVALVGLIQEFQQTLLSVDKLAGVMNRKPERARAGGLTPEIVGHVQFENVDFRYAADGPLVLNGMNFTLAAGQVVGVVGRSGSGKSTLTRLVQGLYAPQGGIVRVDGIDMRELDLAHLRLNIGVVPQHSFLFRGTVRENIAVTRPDAAFSDVVRAARLAGAAEFIERLPQTYDTMLEENASNLSGGQKQRLAIARALLRQPRILIFDEATSALDPESEAIIQANLGQIAAGRTVIMVSHRLSMLVHADTILMVEDGRLVDAAPHSELVRRCDPYRQLWYQQNPHLAAAQAEVPA